MGNPRFHAILKRMATLHDKKAHDYAKEGNYYSNFEEAAVIAATDVDTVFKVMIGIKLARINELQASGKTPNNESLQDSMLDLAVYSVLWTSYHEPVPLDEIIPVHLPDEAADIIAGIIKVDSRSFKC